jgi:hypothetical protein
MHFLFWGVIWRQRRQIARQRGIFLGAFGPEPPAESFSDSLLGLN